ncbi:MAG: NADH:ubiquinone reductase (Na(+)-transporting) subunit D [Gammaproteobacteria bacterium]
MQTDPKTAFLDPLVERNPVIYQILGICPALAISTAMENAFAMGLATAAVLTISNLSVSLIRNLVPDNVRIIIYLVIVASLVIVADQILRTYFPHLSSQLSVYVGLIITNCIVLGRAEAFASRNRPWVSTLDGMGNGLGYALVLCVVAFVRELLGAGQLLGHQVLPTTDNGGWFETVGLLAAPAGAFFVVMVLVWILRAWKTEQVEEA